MTTEEKKSRRRDAAASPADMREEIKRVSIELLIKYGYRGFRFDDIAVRLKKTRGNIHYHFGRKQFLVEELLVEYVVDTMARNRAILLDEHQTLNVKIQRLREFNFERYKKYNRSGYGSKPWSLIARMRADHDLLTLRGKKALKDYAQNLNAAILQAALIAKQNGELSARAPVEDIAMVLSGIANAGPAITQDAGNFEQLERLYEGFLRILMQGYSGAKAPHRAEA